MEGEYRVNYFIFKKNGKNYDSRDYGIGCGGFPAIVIPQKRITVDEITGRNGSLISTDDCYSSYSKIIECYMADDVYKDLSWLSGSGKLILSNELDREYDVVVKNNIELSQVANYWRNFNLKFEVQPFKKSVKQNKMTFTEKEISFTIGGNVPSFPIIEVTGNGEIDLIVNDSTFKIKDLETTILIDSELQIAIENDKNALFKTNGFFPKLIPGENNISIIGEVEELAITYQDTFL